MKSYKLVLASLLLCASQSVFAGTPAQDQAVAAALEVVTNNLTDQTAIERYIAAAAVDGINADAVISQLVLLQISSTTISQAVAHVSASLPSTYALVLNASVAALGSGGSTGAGGGQGGQGGGGLASIGGGFGTPGISGSASGAVSQH